MIEADPAHVDLIYSSLYYFIILTQKNTNYTLLSDRFLDSCIFMIIQKSNTSRADSDSWLVHIRITMICKDIGQRKSRYSLFASAIPFFIKVYQTLNYVLSYEHRIFNTKKTASAPFATEARIHSQSPARANNSISCGRIYGVLLVDHFTSIQFFFIHFHLQSQNFHLIRT